MSPTLTMIISGTGDNSLSSGYIIGAVIALFILGYLIYALVKPERF